MNLPSLTFWQLCFSTLMAIGLVFVFAYLLVKALVIVCWIRGHEWEEKNVLELEMSRGDVTEESFQIDKTEHKSVEECSRCGKERGVE